MGPEVKKTGRQKLLQHKNASTLSQVISVLKIELKTWLSFDVFECEKNHSMGDGRIFLKTCRDVSFKKGLSNEPTFGLIHLLDSTFNKYIDK